MMLIYEYKVDGTQAQYAAIKEAIRVVQFIRNKALRLNSQARQASAARACFAIERFYDHCKHHKPGKKGYPKVRRFGGC